MRKRSAVSFRVTVAETAVLARGCFSECSDASAANGTSPSRARHEIVLTQADPRDDELILRES